MNDFILFSHYLHPSVSNKFYIYILKWFAYLFLFFVLYTNLYCIVHFTIQIFIYITFIISVK